MLVGDLGLTQAQQAEVMQVLLDWQGLRRKHALAQMRLMAKGGGERRFIQDGEGNGGEVKMQIHPTSYHEWGQRIGYECWDDPQFVREYLRDNPESRVKSVSDKTTIRVTHTLAGAVSEHARFHKTYSSEAVAA